MSMHPVIDNLDRCTMALQSLAEGQSSSLTIVLDLLLEQLEDAIGQAATQLRQGTCQGAAQPRVASGAASRGVLTLLPRSRQTPASWSPEDAEEEPLSSRTVGVRACAPGSGRPSGSSPAGRPLAPAARYAILSPRVAMHGYRPCCERPARYCAEEGIRSMSVLPTGTNVRRAWRGRRPHAPCSALPGGPTAPHRAGAPALS
jgi:hypothetical protein